MSSEKVDEAKETEDPKPAPLQSVLKSKSKDALNEETSKSKRVVFQEKPVIINKTVTKNIDSPKNEGAEFDKQKEKKDRSRPPTKVVVRRLPPTMTLDVFIEYVSPLPDHDFIYFVPADMSLGSNAFARVYINFVNLADLITFHEQFDNYVFMDNKGNEYPAVVEFAQFQRIPKKRQGKKRDMKAGTLKDDPEYNAFLEMLQEKKEASSTKQTVDVIIPPDKPAQQITTTPLLEYIKQRRAEQQKLRDERREERRRKELERKRIKDEEKKRRKDAESVLKVLRSHDTEENEDSKSIKDFKEKEWSPSPQGTQSSKRREDDKLKQREEKKKERPVVESSRTRDVKNRESAAKSYRDERQKLAEGRIQRKLADDQRKKGVTERNQNANKHGDTHQSPESEKPVSSKDTHVRKSYVRDVESKRHSSERHNAKEEKSMKDPENRRSYRDNEGRRHERYTHGKDTEHKRSTYSSEHRKLAGSGNDSESRKRLTGFKAHEKEVKNKQVIDIAHEKDSAFLPDQENEMEEQISEVSPSPAKNKLELCISEEMTDQQNNNNFPIKRSSSVSVKRSSSVSGSTRSAEDEQDGKVVIDIKTNTMKRSSSLDLSSVSVVDESKETVDLQEEWNTSLCNSETEEVTSKNSISIAGSNSYENENSEEKVNTNTEQSPSPECETSLQNDVDTISSGDKENHEEINETEEQENEGYQCEESESSLNEGSQHKESESNLNEGSQHKESESILNEGSQCKEPESILNENSQNKESDSLLNESIHEESESVVHATITEKTSDESKQCKEDIYSCNTKDTQNTDVTSAANSGHTFANSSGSENKRDPRAERRIRNKDRPSIEIYRPGMGRFSMQRKEREKSAATTITTTSTTPTPPTSTTSSSIEQESPTTSPSPSPAIRPISASRSRSGQEFRSMTFKRSVSREK